MSDDDGGAQRVDDVLIVWVEDQAALNLAYISKVSV